jgi:WD40 repeat protein
MKRRFTRWFFELSILPIILVLLASRLFGQAVKPAVLTLTGHLDSVIAIAFSPDGKTLASGSADKTVRLWNVAMAKRKRVLRWHADWVVPHLTTFATSFSSLAL